MPRWLRALLISATATAAAALVMRVLPGWQDEAVELPDSASPSTRKQRSTEEVIEDMSDAEKEQMLRELGQHV